MNKRLRRDIIILCIALSIIILIFIVVSNIQFDDTTITSAICEYVTVHDLKVKTNIRICEIVIGEETIDCFHGVFETTKTENYLKIKYNQENMEYVYFLFPEGDIRIYTLVDRILNNNSVYEVEEVYEH